MAARASWVAAPWAMDEDACQACGGAFNLLVAKRRHHCRRCGHSFCGPCSRQRAPMRGSADPQRVCDSCFAQISASAASPRRSSALKAAPAADEVLLEGFLRLQALVAGAGESVQSWKRRYVRLSRRSLRYYRAPGDAMARGELFLEPGAAVEVVSAAEPPFKPFCLRAEARTGSTGAQRGVRQTVLIVAADQAELDEWRAALEAALEAAGEDSSIGGFLGRLMGGSGGADTLAADASTAERHAYFAQHAQAAEVDVPALLQLLDPHVVFKTAAGKVVSGADAAIAEMQLGRQGQGALEAMDSVVTMASGETRTVLRLAADVRLGERCEWSSEGRLLRLQRELSPPAEFYLDSTAAAAAADAGAGAGGPEPIAPPAPEFEPPRLTLTCKSGVGLDTGKPRPPTTYVVLRLGDWSAKSAVVKKSSHPAWNLEAEASDFGDSAMLDVTVMEWNRPPIKDQVLASLSIPVSSLPLSTTVERDFDLRGGAHSNGAKVRLRFVYENPERKWREETFDEPPMCMVIERAVQRLFSC